MLNSVGKFINENSPRHTETTRQYVTFIKICIDTQQVIIIAEKCIKCKLFY